MTLSHVPREQNRKADALSKLGAASSVPSLTLSNPNRGSNNEAGVETTGKLDKGCKKGGEAKVKCGDGEDGRPGMILGKKLFEKTRPLVQWSPDGVYWAEWQSIGGPGESLGTSLKMLIV